AAAGPAATPERFTRALHAGLLARAAAGRDGCDAVLARRRRARWSGLAERTERLGAGACLLSGTGRDERRRRVGHGAGGRKSRWARDLGRVGNQVGVG